MAPALATRLDALNKRTEKIAGATSAQVNKMMEILKSGGGLAGLEDAVAKKILPAAAVAAILSYLMPQGATENQA